MASGSGTYRGGRNRGMLSDAMLRGRVNSEGGREMSARDYYSDLRRMGASREEARQYTLEYMNATTLG